MSESVNAWLADKPYGLWAQFNIGDPATRHKAADWFVKQVTEYGDWLKRQGQVDL